MSRILTLTAVAVGVSADLSLATARKCLSSMVKCVMSLPPWVGMYLTGLNVP